MKRDSLFAALGAFAALASFLLALVNFLCNFLYNQIKEIKEDLTKKQERVTEVREHVTEVRERVAKLEERTWGWESGGKSEWHHSGESEKHWIERIADNAVRISYDDATSELIFERYNTATGAWEESLKKNLPLKNDTTNSDFRIRDTDNAVDLFRLKKNTVVIVVPFTPSDCINLTGLSAASTGVKFISVVKAKVDARCLRAIRLRASWTASNTDSVTEVRAVGSVTGTIVSVSGNTGTNVEATGTGFSDGELVHVEVAVTTASATTTATTDLVYAVIEFIYMV